MRSRSVLVLAASLVVLPLTACATATTGGGAPAPDQVTTTAAATESSPSPTGDAAALERAQAWLDGAVLPPGAVRSEAGAGRFSSFTGWPCGPVEQLEAFWTLPGATVRDTANWLRENPAAGLMTTSYAPLPDDLVVDSAIVGFVPEPDAQEGVVYTLASSADGVAVRAEIAAQTASATCPPLPDGGAYGAPGQG